MKYVLPFVSNLDFGTGCNPSVLDKSQRYWGHTTGNLKFMQQRTHGNLVILPVAKGLL